MTLTPKLISTPPAFSASMQLSPDGMKIAARGALLLCVVTGVISGVLTWDQAMSILNLFP